MSVETVKPAAQPTEYDKLVDAAKIAFKACLKERGTKKSKALLIAAIDAMAAAAAAEYV